ncbi:MAG TPA: ankyrin repeat domain-containing protein [Terriglobales bacterium]|nr:ankyrin repeat domain-containing protein [Terriglobales bacterium]
MDTRGQLIEAIKDRDGARVREILEQDATAASARDSHGVSAMMLALYHGQQGAVDLLRVANPNLDIFEAAGLGETRRVDELLRADPSLVRGWSPDGFTALHLAAFFSHPETARALVEAGSDVNVASRNGMQVAPLHSAAAGHNFATVRILLEHGADPNARQHGGWTPIHAAAQDGDEDMVDLLIKHGADPTLKNDVGLTPLDVAKEKGHSELASRLSAA